MNKIKFLYILILALFFSCNEQEKEIMGYWSIERYQADFEIRVNGFYLFDDYTCILPVLNLSDQNTDKEKGTWSTFKDSNSFYLKIASSNNELAGEYKVENYRKIEDKVIGGFLYKVEFTKDNLKLYCVKNGISTHKPDIFK